MNTNSLRAWFLVFASALLLGAGVRPEQKHPPVRPSDAETPLLVWDVDPLLKGPLPRNFRSCSDPLPQGLAPVPDLKGLRELHASGSAQFTAGSLQAVLARLRAPVLVLDLRMEDHLFVNGEPVSWMATNNWANLGRSHDAIRASETSRASSIAKGTSLVLADDRNKKDTAGAFPTRTVVADLVQTEEELVRSLGASYARLTLPDHARPTDDEVDRFIGIVRTLPEGMWMHLHCRAGKGRTTTFLVLYDMLRNAEAVGMTDIVRRQTGLVGDYDLMAEKPSKEENGKLGLAEDRASFIRAFYEYARENRNGRPLLWTEWLGRK